MKPVIKIRHLNFFDGFDDDLCRSHVLMDLCDEFEFIFSDPPDVILINCYGQREVPSCDALKVGYYTENIAPDLVNFDFFFGCEYSDIIDDPKYCKRVYGSLPGDLFGEVVDTDVVFRRKTDFCNFIYSSRVPFRERFFTQLQQYRPIAAPGRSMNNCSGLSARDSGDWQREKLDYLRKFKFTIAFENSRRIGYATEKLYDALRANTVPIYWGDPLVDRVVNPGALIVVDGDWENDVLPWLQLPQQRMPYRPYARDRSLLNRISGRSDDLLQWLRSRVPYRRGFADAIEEILALDRDEAAYKRKLAEPKLNPGVIKMRSEYFDFWRKILRRIVPAFASA
jgi:hypothetical protein